MMKQITGNYLPRAKQGKERLAGKKHLLNFLLSSLKYLWLIYSVKMKEKQIKVKISTGDLEY